MFQIEELDATKWNPEAARKAYEKEHAYRCRDNKEEWCITENPESKSRKTVRLPKNCNVINEEGLYRCSRSISQNLFTPVQINPLIQDELQQKLAKCKITNTCPGDTTSTSTNGDKPFVQGSGGTTSTSTNGDKPSDQTSPIEKSEMTKQQKIMIGIGAAAVLVLLLRR